MRFGSVLRADQTECYGGTYSKPKRNVRDSDHINKSLGRSSLKTGLASSFIAREPFGALKDIIRP